MLASFVEHRVDAGYGLERASGPVGGGEVALRFGARWQVAVRLQGGSLTARTTGALHRDVGEIGVEAGLRTAQWLTLRVGVTRRVYATMLARQGWAIVSLGAEARVPIAAGAVQAIANGALLPVTAVSGLSASQPAFAAATGMEYRRGGRTLRILYSLERYDFRARSGARRLEQVSALTVALGMRFGGRTP